MNGSGFAQATTDSSGNYTMTVGGEVGELCRKLQVWLDWAYGDKPQELKFATDTSAESKTVNFTVNRASSTITGRILKPDGTPVSGQTDNIGVGVYSQEGQGGEGRWRANGTFSVRVPAGTYNFNVWAPPNSSYGTPTVSPITVKIAKRKM